MTAHLSRRHSVRLVFEGTLVGLFVGCVIALYRLVLTHAEEALRFITGNWISNVFGVLAWFAILAVICVAVGRFLLWEPYTQGSGIPQTDAEVAGRINMPWLRVLLTKFVEGALCAFSGLSLGREGPSVLLGAMGGKGVSRLLKNERPHERLLITCGAASGMSAAFHAPLTGVLFAVEEIHKEFSAPLIISVMVSSVLADLVSSGILGISPLIHFVSYSEIPRALYVAVPLLGLGCGLLGFLHNAGMFFMQEQVFGRITKCLPYARIAVPFALAGVVAFVWPDLLCGGDAIIEKVLDARSQTIGMLVLLLLGKYVFTAICFGSGAPGGTLLPLVVMGSLVGAIYGMGAMQLIGVSGVYENDFIVLGMAGMFSAVIQAPVTAVIMVFELTGSSQALLSTSIVSVVAFVTARLLKSAPFYEHLFARLLGETLNDMDVAVNSGNKVMRTYVVGAGSRVEGHSISEVDWPEGTLVVTISKAGQEFVPDGNTCLEALDEICVIMSEDKEFDYNNRIRSLCAGTE